eukprot:4998856-Amphidinium_carterae.1
MASAGNRHSQPVLARFCAPRHHRGLCRLTEHPPTRKALVMENVTSCVLAAGPSSASWWHQLSCARRLVTHASATRPVHVASLRDPHGIWPRRRPSHLVECASRLPATNPKILLSPMP